MTPLPKGLLWVPSPIPLLQGYMVFGPPSSPLSAAQMYISEAQQGRGQCKITAIFDRTVPQKGVCSTPEHTRGSQEFGLRAESFPVDCRHCCWLSVLDLPQRSCMTGSGRNLSLPVID